jgi:uncharacterized short protein YbdD (DUF466 family)
MNREQLIEKAAKAMAILDDYDGCFERLAGTDPEEPLSTDEEDAEFWRKRARAALAVFEEANTPSDDEREALDDVLYPFFIQSDGLHDFVTANQAVDAVLAVVHRATQSEHEALLAMTAEKEKWRIRCAEETIAWADATERADALHRTVQGEPKRMLMTHPHDGHGPNDTCRDCVQGEPSDAAVLRAVDAFMRSWAEDPEGLTYLHKHMDAALRAVAETEKGDTHV